MFPPQSTIAIVDAYSAARQYSPELKKRGFDCIHVQSSKTIPEGYARSFVREDFLDNFIFDGSFEPLVTGLKNAKVTAVLAGTESGVLIADQLSEALGLVTNGTEKSAARRDKNLMWNSVKDAGLPVARFFAAKDLLELSAWVNREKLSRVVLKPAASAGTDSIYVCEDSTQIEAAFKAILGQTNSLGLHNDVVLAQEYIVGEEYVINVVALEGIYRITEVIHYIKHEIPGRGRLYDRDILLDETDPVAQKLIPYVFGVLKALNIRNGPAHTEVWMTAEGPRLMETAARVDGLIALDFARQLANTNQVDLTLDAYTAPEAFHTKAKQPHRLLKQGGVTNLICRQSGRLKSHQGLERIEKLPSFCWMNIKVKPGDRITPTVDLFTCPGYVYLLHDSAAQIEADYRAIREFEKGGLFDVE